MNIELFANLPKYLHRHCALTDKLDKRLAEILHLQKAPIPNSLSPLMSASVSHGKLSRAGTKLTFIRLGNLAQSFFHRICVDHWM